MFLSVEYKSFWLPKNTEAMTVSSKVATAYLFYYLSIIYEKLKVY